jgi:hypothetical protein
MPATILKDLAKQGDVKMTVVVQDPSPEEVTSTDTRREVLLFARSQGFPAMGFNTLPQAYPVDGSGNGEPFEDFMKGKRVVAGYRGDYVLYSRLPR